MHIVVIGAGLAGIAAANVLSDVAAGHTVTLVEASARYGGRALSDTRSVPGFVLEKGATQIQDPDINPLVEVAKQLHFAMTEEPYPPAWLRVQGNLGWVDEPVDYAPVEQVGREMQASYDLAKSQPNAVAAPPFVEFGQYQLLALMTSGLGPIVASADPWRYLAADHARESDAKLGTNLFVTDGIGTLVEAFGATLTDFDERFTPLFESPVQRIDWNGTGVRVSGLGLDVQADGCIVTVPVSQLAAHAIEFVPALPSAQQTALEALKLGSYKKFAATLVEVPEGLEPGNTYYVADVANCGAWECLRTGGQPDVLFAQTAGDFAARLDAQDDEEVFQQFSRLLQDCYGGKPLVFGAERAMTNWTKAPFIQGAYSYTAPLGENPASAAALGARTALAAPLGRLRIAGEATNITYYGTLQAAYFEGERAARELMALQ